MRYWAWFMQAPLLFDLTGGVFYDAKTNEGTKLTRLGSEWLVGKEAGWMSVAGLLMGLGAAISLRGLLQNFVVSEDLSLPSVFLLGPFVFFVVVAIAVLAPVRRASRANPAAALRAE